MVRFDNFLLELGNFEIYLESIIVPAIIALASTIFILLIRKLFFKVIHRWSQGTDLNLGMIIINSIKTPSIKWCIALGLFSGISLSEIPAKYVIYINKLIYVILIFSVTLALSNLAVRLIQYFMQKSSLSLQTTGLAFFILNAVIFITGFLFILSVLGIPITPVITALGVGGIAVALALKDTLTNLFAGIHILLEKSIRVGDFVKLESGQEGQIEDMTWRTARIRTISNNTVIIPNSKLSQSIVINYFLPEETMALQIPISVGYSSDIEKVENILLDISKKAAGEVTGLLDRPEPVVRFIPGFMSSSLDFTLICHIKEFKFTNIVQHELRKRILRRFREEGIEIPYPHRTVYLRKEEA